MKKYFLGFFAAALAVLSFAFTNPSFEYRTMVDLVFTGSLTSETSVETESNWDEGSPSGCSITNDKACRIQIDHTKLSGTAPNRFLNSSVVTVNADAGGEAGFYKVTSLSGDPGEHTIENKD